MNIKLFIRLSVQEETQEMPVTHANILACCWIRVSTAVRDIRKNKTLAKLSAYTVIYYILYYIIYYDYYFFVLLL